MSSGQRLLLKWVLCLVSYTALATLAFEGLCLPFPRGDRVGHRKRCSPEDGWTAGRRGQSARRVPKVHLSPGLWRGARLRTSEQLTWLDLSRPHHTGHHQRTLCSIQQLSYRYFKHGCCNLLQKEIKLKFFGLPHFSLE